tara:strand:- start:326 stop:2527 length:2202 start_codon:yes stop_codon:yes gene_type:complete
MINAAYFTAVNNSFVNIGSIIPSFRDDNIGTILMDSIDVNSDGAEEIVMHFYQGYDASNELGVDQPSLNKLVFFQQNSSGQWEHSTNDLLSLNLGPADLPGWVRQWEIVDLNGDGLSDIAFAGNKEDGRSGSDSQKLAVPAAVLISGTQYSVVELNGENWHHAVGASPAVGSKPALSLFSGYANPDYAFSFLGDVAVREELPRNLSGGNIEYLSHLSSQNSNKSFFFSDLRSSANDGFSAPGLVVRDASGNWSTIEGNLPFDITDSKTVTQTSWMGGTSNIQFFKYGNDYIQSSTYTDALEINLFPFSDPLLVAKYASSRLNDINATEVTEGVGTTVNQYYHFFEVSENAINIREVNIENLAVDVNANFFQVFDFNNDGFDDLIENTYKNGQPNVYLNTQSGGFSKVSVDSLFPLNEYLTKNWNFQMKFLNFKDDGLFDLVVFPSAGTQPQSLASHYDYYVASNPVMSGPNFSDPALSGEPGFNELYYLRKYSDANDAVTNGSYESGLAYYQAIGKNRGDLIFNAGSKISGSNTDDVIKAFDLGFLTINAGEGVDSVVYGSTKSSYMVEGSSNNWTVSNSSLFSGYDELKSVERIKFSDGTLALDIDAGDTAGQAYRLYQAAFARTPDMPGVSYHMNDMEGNGLVLENIANNFIASPEFKTKYGENPSNDEFIDLLYQNVLGRSADSDGLAFYTNHFTAGTMTRAAALIGFAESPENVTLVAPQIEDGIWLAS